MVESEFVRPPREVSVTIGVNDTDEQTFTFRGLGRSAYESLVSFHATSDSIRRLPYELNTFAPALLHLCAIEPEVSQKDAEQIWNEWSMGETNALLEAALSACQADSSIFSFSERLRLDPRLSVELAYCVPLGIPHSKFLSWSEDDQDKAIAWTLDQQSLCGQCRTRRSDWEENEYAYIARVERCPGCEAIEYKQDDTQEQAKMGASTKGLKFYLGLPTAEERRTLLGEKD